MKTTHTIEWEPIKGLYRILTLVGDKRQPTLDEARSYMAQHGLPEAIWCCGFLNNGECMFDGFSSYDEVNKTLTLYEYTGHFGDEESGLCPICGHVLDMFHNKDKCPTCGKEW